MPSEPRSPRRRTKGLPILVAALALAAGIFLAPTPAVADQLMSREQTSAPQDDPLLRLGLGLDVGSGTTITNFNAFPGADTTLFFTSLRATYDVSHRFAAMLTLHQWWLPGPNHALLLGLGARYEPFQYRWGLIYFDAALGPASTGYAWTFGFDLGAGLEFFLPDAPGFSLGPYLRYGDFINPDRSDSDDGLAWSIGASFTYHFGRAAAAPRTTSEPQVRRGIWHISLPDSDHDGVADDEDQCKDVPAGKHPDPFRPGCPENDEDGDGIPDVDDPCPVTAPGPTPDPKRPGCPFIDTDGDGISDADDACVTKPGPASSDPAKNGCPDGHTKVKVAPPPPSATDEELAPKPVKKHRSVHRAPPPPPSESSE